MERARVMVNSGTLRELHIESVAWMDDKKEQWLVSNDLLSFVQHVVGFPLTIIRCSCLTPPGGIQSIHPKRDHGEMHFLPGQQRERHSRPGLGLRRRRSGSRGTGEASWD